MASSRGNCGDGLGIQSCDVKAGKAQVRVANQACRKPAINWVNPGNWDQWNPLHLIQSFRITAGPANSKSGASTR
ncbi:uncharacterized protein SPSK_10944 [Sporothrix schenckii 1099-18]|uniref:Uncharacterized protein n=1 Tax=Sporothrix schenckii 1099-18 TaxID=1397361 RepID=A0A0F2MAH8_SPOSC|nr:uncharacterized protein SPSK_10944 [Sporothrix schenckii 1099-18]KJR85166.1 hypothetical protein SPSK_10944 [Sporothrix schenckii 1099-18]